MHSTIVILFYIFSFLLFVVMYCLQLKQLMNILCRYANALSNIRCIL